MCFPTFRPRIAAGRGVPVSVVGEHAKVVGDTRQKSGVGVVFDVRPDGSEEVERVTVQRPLNVGAVLVR